MAHRNCGDPLCGQFDDETGQCTFCAKSRPTAAKVQDHHVKWDIKFENEQAYKSDAGKIDTLVLEQDFVDALEVIAQVFNFGLEKYERRSWMKVLFGRWDAAARRHQRARDRGVNFDPESGLLHLAHEAAGKIVMLQKHIMDNPGFDYLTYKKPPQGHKQNGSNPH